MTRAPAARSTPDTPDANALREINEQLRLAQAAGGIGLFMIDIATDTITVSPEFCRMFGVPEQPQFHSPDLEALQVDPRDPMSHAQDRRAGTTPLDAEYRIRRASDGAVRWIARRAQIVCDADGRPLQMRGAVQDVTDRKNVEATLRQSEAGFRALAQAIPAQVWTAMPDGQLDWFNQQVFDYAGLSLPELVGDGWAAMVHPDDLPKVTAHWQRSLETQTPYETEFRLRRHDGAWRWHLARAQPVVVNDVDRVRWVGTNTDIEDQKMAQAKLAQRVEERTRDRDRLWQLSSDIMVVADFEGRISAINPAWETLLGWTEAELIGSRILELMHPDDGATTNAELVRLAQGYKTLGFECRVRHRDGSYRSLSWTAVPDARFLHAVGRDVTALRESEARLRQSQKMEAIGQLTGGIAHDFNNLLQGITGSIEIMRRRMLLGRTDGLERYLDSATQSAHRAATLIQRLLAFSRRQSLDARPVNVSRLVASMEDLLRRTLGEQVRLHVALDAQAHDAVGDESQLESAILNLAINARDAMPDGGELRITTAAVTPAEFAAYSPEGLAPGDYLAISVSDTGGGMPPDVLSKAFDPFFTTKPIGQGTGLGLSMVYGFAQQSHGHVHIDSRVGEGTTVTLWLPRGEPPSDAPAADGRADAPPQGSGQVVLVVEDDPAVRMLVLDVLVDLGYRALEAADGNAAIAILGKEPRIDLLVSDVGLPGINGRQLAEIARQQRPALPVLFMTGYAEHATTRSAFLAAGMQLIAKPFTIDALAHAIEQMVDGNAHG